MLKISRSLAVPAGHEPSDQSAGQKRCCVLAQDEVQASRDEGEAYVDSPGNVSLRAHGG